MTLHISVLPSAERDLQRLYDFLKPKNPRAAKRALEKIFENFAILADAPRLGRIAEYELPYRLWVVEYGSGAYIIRYKVDGEKLVIIRVWHSREQR